MATNTMASRPARGPRRVEPDALDPGAALLFAGINHEVDAVDVDDLGRVLQQGRERAGNVGGRAAGRLVAREDVFEGDMASC